MEDQPDLTPAEQPDESFPPAPSPAGPPRRVHYTRNAIPALAALSGVSFLYGGLKGQALLVFPVGVYALLLMLFLVAGWSDPASRDSVQLIIVCTMRSTWWASCIMASLWLALNFVHHLHSTPWVGGAAVVSVAVGVWRGSQYGRHHSWKRKLLWGLGVVAAIVGLLVWRTMAMMMPTGNLQILRWTLEPRSAWMEPYQPALVDFNGTQEGGTIAATIGGLEVGHAYVQPNAENMVMNATQGFTARLRRELGDRFYKMEYMTYKVFPTSNPNVDHVDVGFVQKSDVVMDPGAMVYPGGKTTKNGATWYPMGYVISVTKYTVDKQPGGNWLVAAESTPYDIEQPCVNGACQKVVINKTNIAQANATLDAAMVAAESGKATQPNAAAVMQAAALGNAMSKPPVSK